MTDETQNLPRRAFVATLAAGAVLPWPEVEKHDSLVAALTDSTLHYASVGTLVAAIRQKRVSSLEIVEACLKRTEQVNSKINAMVYPTADRARAAAKAAFDRIEPLKEEPDRRRGSIDEGIGAFDDQGE